MSAKNLALAYAIKRRMSEHSPTPHENAQDDQGAHFCESCGQEVKKFSDGGQAGAELDTEDFDDADELAPDDAPEKADPDVGSVLAGIRKKSRGA